MSTRTNRLYHGYDTGNMEPSNNNNGPDDVGIAELNA